MFFIIRQKTKKHLKKTTEYIKISNVACRKKEFLLQRIIEMKNIKGSLILLLTALIWGVAFVAQTSASDTVGSFTFNTARSAMASLFLLVVIGIRALINRKKTIGSKPVFSKRQTIVGGLICGVLLCIATNFQQFGIAEYPEGVAASGRAGFLTSTYVVMVAVVSVFFGKKSHPIVWVSAAGCISGMYLLCLSNGFSGIYKADVLLFICAMCFTAHIIAVSRFPMADGILLSFIQFAVCGALSAVLMLIFEHRVDISSILAIKVELLYAGIMSSGIAYTLQILGQKYADPAVASIVLSLESVFSALAGWVILSERLSPKELAGCALVFASVIMAQMPEFIKDKNKKAKS